MMTAVEALYEAGNRVHELPTRMRSAEPGGHLVNRGEVLFMLADLITELEVGRNPRLPEVGGGGTR